MCPFVQSADIKYNQNKKRVILQSVLLFTLFSRKERTPCRGSVRNKRSAPAQAGPAATKEWASTAEMRAFPPPGTLRMVSERSAFFKGRTL